MVKAVIDTNIFIGMLLKSKNCLEIRETFLDGLFDIVISTVLLKELIATIRKPKFKNIFHPDDIEELIDLIKTDAEWITTSEKISICRDPKDNPALECAVAGAANLIVTGDKDLLVLKSFRKVPIITPRKFLEIISS